MKDGSKEEIQLYNLDKKGYPENIMFSSKFQNF
jgi:hypothetical protein